MRSTADRNRNRRLSVAAVAAAATVATAAVASPAAASDPTATTLSGSGRRTSVTKHFSGTILGTGYLIPGLCTGATCDSHTLHMDVPRRFWATHDGKVSVTVSWDDPDADLDLAIHDARGNVVAEDYTWGSEPESVSLGELAPGSYTISVMSWAAPPETSYTGTIKMVARPVVQRHHKRHHRRHR